MKVLIGMPAGEYIKTKTVFSLFHLAGPDVRLQMVMSCDVAENRNKLAQYAIDNNFSHIFFLDSDITFNGDALELLLKRDKDIIALAFNHRRLPLESVIAPLDGNLGKPMPTDLFEAASCGTGGMLIRTLVFRDIPKPWFDFTYENGERVGEDVNFCRKARKAGYKIWVDPTIPVRHIGEYLY